MIGHADQQRIWEEEHRNPSVLPQMDSDEASSGVVKFYEWLRGQNREAGLKGLEMCCGKGRSVIWLAEQGIQMRGVDFSQAAIAEAKRRSADSTNAHFVVHDVTLPFPVAHESQDFVVDCFGSTDIESPALREKARDNMIATLKPGGYYFTYLLSTDDAYHKLMIKNYHGPEPGSFLHPENGKFEKAFTETEVKEFYKTLELITLERIEKTATFNGKQYPCRHIWAIFKKP